jgi:hypothetical protein
MFRLRRFYLDSIGVPENRFADLLVDLTDLDGEPADAIVWLRNGAGKTTMLSLLLALILPDRRDFLATRTKKRTLEDLVLGGDTAHVVAEWVDPAGQLLLTGAVYEWDNRVRPRDYNGPGKDRLRRSWWCVHPDPEVAQSTLDDLPFTLRSKGRYDRERFKAHVQDLATQGVNAVVADQTIAEWHAALRERRFDPELFHYFTEVNAAEGGIDGLFSGIDSPGAFVRYLLRFVGDKQRVGPVRELLADTAGEIAKRPIYLAEREFCGQARPKVTALGTAHQAVLDATVARDLVITRAAGYKRALHEAEAIARGRQATAQQQMFDLDAALTKLRGAVDAARRRRDEYRRSAAEFRVQTAVAAVTQADVAAERAQQEADAWAAVTDHVRLAIVHAELDTKKELMYAAAEEARPLVEGVEKAKAILAGALENETRKADIALTGKRSALEDAKRQRDTALSDQQDAVRLIAELDGEVQAAHDAIARFGNDRDALIAAAIVGDGEQLDIAARRLRDERDSITARIERLRGEQSDVDHQIGDVDQQLARHRTAAGKADVAYQQAAGLLEQLSRRAVRLADSARLRALLQADTVDLTHGSADALDALGRAVSTADVELIRIRALVAEDELAVRALADEKLLPPRAQVTEVLKKLTDEGITAHSGWRYLAQHVPESDHARCISELPEVVDGVIVYGDPAAAATRLTEPVDDLVVLASATTFRDRRPPHVVVGPAAARYDYDAAAAELGRRRKRLADNTESLDEISRQQTEDATLRLAIDAFVYDLPDDGIDGLRTRVTAAKAAWDTAAERVQTAMDLLDQLRQRLKELGEEIGERRERLAHVVAALPRVLALARDERDVVEPTRLRLAAIPTERQRLRERHTVAAERYRLADNRITGLNAEINTLRQRCGDWATRREPLPRPAMATDLPLDAAEAAVAEAELQLRENFPEQELRLAITRSERDVTDAGQAWNARPEPVRRRAVALAETSDGADAGLRAAAADRARGRSSEANQAVGEAKAELRAAYVERDAAPQARRRTTDDVETPTDREHAQRLAAAAEEEAVEGQQRVGQTERERETAHQAAQAAETRAGMLRDQAALLRQVDAAAVAVGVVPDDDNETRSVVGGLITELEESRSVYDAADRVRADEIDKLRRWASADRFAKVAEDEHGQAVYRLREMFRGERVIDRVAAAAGDLADDLDLREKAIGQQLAQVETHKNNVVARMTDLVDDALGLLGRASTLSELPEGIGPWAHQRFLTVEARSRPSKEQIGLRVGELVDRMVRGGKIELDAVELLWRATEAAVVEGFRATVLKPAPDQPTGRTPVEEMRKWSGGENLTASLVLFCVLARLRAEQRTGTRAASAGGLVPLDNPLGKANYLPFLDLQRRVARASGVQLVFWTGIGDLGAVTTFPRIAAMHKRPSTTRAGRAYVQVDQDNTQVVDVVSAVRRDP